MRNKGYVMVYVKAGKPVSDCCEDLGHVETLLAENELSIDEVLIFASRPIVVKRALLVAKAPRAKKAATGAKKHRVEVKVDPAPTKSA